MSAQSRSRIVTLNKCSFFMGVPYFIKIFTAYDKNALEFTISPKLESFQNEIYVRCNDQTDEINKLFIIWPFHYGPKPAINQNQQLISG